MVVFGIDERAIGKNIHLNNVLLNGHRIFKVSLPRYELLKASYRQISNLTLRLNPRRE